MTVTASRLRSCKVYLRGSRLKAATIMPFFDCTGRVQQIMLLQAGSCEIRFLELIPGRIAVTWWGPIQISASLADFNFLEQDGIISLNLWHFDPWWLLTQGGYRFHALTPCLKQTNCAEKFGTAVSEVRFSSDLSRLVTVVEKHWQGYSLCCFDGSLLPPGPFGSESIPDKLESEWQLDPVWKDGWRYCRTLSLWRPQ